MSNIYNVKPQTLQQWLDEDEAVLVDVREHAEYSAESINYARNLPLSQLTIDNAHVLDHRHKKLVIHCHSGSRSMTACEKLIGDDASYDIWNLEGGILAWKEAGLPVTASGKKVLPLDRQVQLAISLMILVGMMLGHFVSYTWFVLPLIAGLGLLNAGLTGWCGLAKIMAKTPWNRG